MVVVAVAVVVQLQAQGKFVAGRGEPGIRMIIQ